MALKAWRELISPHRDVLEGPFYVNNLFNQEPDFGVTSINYDIDSLLNK